MNSKEILKKLEDFGRKILLSKEEVKLETAEIKDEAADPGCIGKGCAASRRSRVRGRLSADPVGWSGH